MTRITKVEQSNNWHVARRGASIGGRPALIDCQSMLAIIGGSGLTRLSTLAVAHREVVRTPYGEPSSALLYGQIAGREVDNGGPDIVLRMTHDNFVIHGLTLDVNTPPFRALRIVPT